MLKYQSSFLYELTAAIRVVKQAFLGALGSDGAEQCLHDKRRSHAL